MIVNADHLLALVRDLHPDQLFELVEELPEAEAALLLGYIEGLDKVAGFPDSPLSAAQRIVEGFRALPHLVYLSERIAAALEDVENGKSRALIVEMPPRSGKSLLATQIAPAWMLAKHPDWPVVVTSYSGTLATSWGRVARRWAAEGVLSSDLKVARDSGAASDWETTEGGSFRARSLREGLTGFGAKVMIVDDPHKDHADAHSEASRNSVWNWWTTVAQLRLQPPSLVIVIMTRWHEDDLVGRLLAPETEYPGDPDDWEVIRFPAIADEEDALGREVGDPLFSPFVEETPEEAVVRWEKVKRSVGLYAWSALYQQAPSPASGAIFGTDWWRYWTTDPAHADGDKTILIDPNELPGARWLDSWDFTFKGGQSSDFVVGQRWVQSGADRFLIAQKRGRMDFTEAVAAMEAWGGSHPVDSPYGQHVHQRLVEDAANGPAIISTLKRQVSGIKPITAKNSKEARARAVTPEIESGNVRLPHPSMPGYGWVLEYVDEFRNFPNGANDDQVDSTTQALLELRTPLGGGLSLPGQARKRSGSAIPTPGRR